MAVQICIPKMSVGGFSHLCTPSAAFIVGRVFADDRSERREMVVDCSFDLCFSSN